METSITPFRWYDKYYKQNRFEKDCSNENEFKLITDRKSLLPFQFKRAANGQAISTWILRRACDDYEPALLNGNDSNFVEGAMNWQNGAEFVRNCDVFRSGTVDLDELVYFGLLTVGKTYRFSFFVADVKRATVSNLYLSFNNGATIIVDNITDIDNYEGTFTATSADISFVIHNDGSAVAGEYIGIKTFDLFSVFEVLPTDIELDTTRLNLYNFGTYDHIVFCGTYALALNSVLFPVGDYYSIMKDTGGNYFFSEVITIKNFIREKSPYYVLEWRNTCDIQDVIYQTIDCEYTNRLYLDEAAISKPEYPFTEEGSQDGNQTFVPTFQKWEKKRALSAVKCPEFIIDALSAIRLHDTIRITEPLRIKQTQIDNPTEVESVEFELQPILDDCFSNAVLKFLMGNKYVDETCCTNNTLVACEECTIVIGEENILDTEIGWAYLVSKDGYPVDGLYELVGETWTLVEPDELTIICVGDKEEDPKMIFVDGDWYTCPFIFGWGVESGWSLDRFYLTGFGYPNSFIQAEISIDGGDTWVKDPQILTIAKFMFPGFYINYEDNNMNVMIRIHNFTLNCDYGYSEVVSWDFTV